MHTSNVMVRYIYHSSCNATHLMLWLGTFTILPVMHSSFNATSNVMVRYIYHSSCNATSNVMVRYIYHSSCNAHHLMLWLGTFTILPVMHVHFPSNVMVRYIYHSSCNATSNVMVRYIYHSSCNATSNVMVRYIYVMQYLMLLGRFPSNVMQMLWLGLIGTFTILPVIQHLMLG